MPLGNAVREDGLGKLSLLILRQLGRSLGLTKTMGNLGINFKDMTH